MTPMNLRLCCSNLSFFFLFHRYDEHSSTLSIILLSFFLLNAEKSLPLPPAIPLPNVERTVAQQVLEKKEGKERENPTLDQ